MVKGLNYVPSNFQKWPLCKPGKCMVLSRKIACSLVTVHSNCKVVLKLTFIGFHPDLIFSILLLAEGRTAYMGSTAEALSYFRRY